MNRFVLDSLINGESYSARAGQRDGLIADTLPDQTTHPAHSISRAARIAAGSLGPGLARVDREHLEWGLRLEMGSVSIAWRWPELFASPPDDDKRDPALERLLARWRPEDGARAALANAVRVIEYLGSSRRHRLAA